MTLKTLYSLPPFPLQAIEARLAQAPHTPAAETGDVLNWNLVTGFLCRNDDQPDGKDCQDYEVRVMCRECCRIAAGRIKFHFEIKTQKSQLPRSLPASGPTGRAGTSLRGRATTST